MDINDKLTKIAIELGATKAKIVEVKDIPFEAEFRKMCEMNSCGNYGKNWMCPPEIGEINELMKQAQSFEYTLVYQTINSIEDSFDIEGMLLAGEKHNALAANIDKNIANFSFSKVLHLGAGGCRLCQRCAKIDNELCRFPNQAMSSLEAYGVSVSELATLSEMKYINGQNTVTYFGALFFDL